MAIPIPSNHCLTTRRATVDDFFYRSPPDEKADLIDGTVYVSPPESIHEHDVRMFVALTIGRFIGHMRIVGHVFNCRVAFMFSSDCAIEPDVGYVAPERAHLIGEDRVQGPPDLAVEVISDATRVYDLEVKRALYAENGVREFLTIDPILGDAPCEVLQRRRYVACQLDGSAFRSTVIPGFWLNLDWLLSNPVADESSCLRQILAG